VIDRWRLDYNHYRIHSALNYQAPAAYTARLCSSSFGYASASRTQPSCLTPILSLRLAQRRGGDQFKDISPHKEIRVTNSNCRSTC
jgi:hypothetical protein